MGRRFLWAALLGTAVRHVDALTLNAKCDEGQSAKLVVQGNNAECLCNSVPKGSANMDEYFQVNVEVSTLELDLADAPNVKGLNFSGNNNIVSFSGDSLSLQGFTNMQSLWFKDVTFDPANVTLDILNNVKDIHIVESTMEDLHLSQYPESLTVIDLSGTSISMIPGILYENRYTNEMNLTVDLSSVSEKTTLSSTAVDILEANVKTLSTQNWAQQYSNCTPDGTISPDGSQTLSCSSGTSSSPSDSTTSTSIVSPSTSSNHTSSSSGSSADANAGDDSSSGISTGALVAIIVVVILIAVVLAFFILRMYFRRRAANTNSQNNEATATLMSKSDATADKGSFISNDEFLRNFRLPQSDVALVKSMGTGRLWMGEYNGGKVVVKRVESEVTDSYVTKALMAQARTFATISHPNITTLVGVTWLAGTDFAVVTEFMDKGNLKTVLANTDVDLDVTIKVQMCCDVALALAYLHETEQNLCAKQLSSQKVLVNKTMNCKLSLFECVPSSAKLGGMNTANSYSYGMGEVAWLPPEVITRSSPMDARKHNIYAFGVLVSEIFTRVTPYQSLVEGMGNTMSDVELVSRVRRQDQLVPHENRREFLEAPASVRQLVEQCLSYAPMSRPTAKDLVEVLHNAKEELATNSI